MEQNQNPHSMDNLFITKYSKKDQSQQKRKMVIAGHRGGFQPDNTLFAFKKAKDNNVEAVELDIWLTKDDQIVVIHGGQEGAMPPKINDKSTENSPDVMIYDLTYQEVLDHFKETQVYHDSLKHLDEKAED